jgi:hypothetical protein
MEDLLSGVVTVNLKFVASQLGEASSETEDKQDNHDAKKEKVLPPYDAPVGILAVQMDV